MTARKPTALRRLNGSAAHDPQRNKAHEPVLAPLRDVPPAPDWLVGADALATFEQLAEAAILLGVLTSADLAALAATAAAFSEYRAAAGWRERDSAWKRWVAGLGKFGLTPSDRAHVHVVPVPAIDPLADLLVPRVERGLADVIAQRNRRGDPFARLEHPLVDR